MNNPRPSLKPGFCETVPLAATTESADRVLIQRILEGDRGAYREFERRYHHLIYSTLRRRQVREQDQDDIYQELYVRLWSHDFRCLRRWQATGMSHFSRYLVVILRNLICDWYRPRANTRQIANCVDPAVNAGLTEFAGISCYTADGTGDLDGPLLRREQASAVRKAIDCLRDRDADLVMRRYFADQGYKEIAQALGITVDNVGVALTNARKRLGRHLSRLQPGLFDETGRLG